MSPWNLVVRQKLCNSPNRQMQALARSAKYNAAIGRSQQQREKAQRSLKLDWLRCLPKIHFGGGSETPIFKFSLNC